ncbi:predicted protein [Naegleria gruberi]|uniref:Predicted protein n=1 Tax=Naegleria gruberi TaxID=5762 RepID=D2VZ78_NAEGR|nr:uncharacterized protein NAEGRDRAFT_74392 [Naegleria gruberi]EFC37946.1 predicted protein [Naegleria gruberi]|eukprot:XP_002670690.1 predicted protein [Naegleria gruberi strain NEG-M]
MLLVHYSTVIDKSLQGEGVNSIVQLFSYSFSALGKELTIKFEGNAFQKTGSDLDFTLKERNSIFQKKETGELISCTRRIPLQSLDDSFCIVWGKEFRFTVYRKLPVTFLFLSFEKRFNLEKFESKRCDSLIFLANSMVLRFRNVYVVYDYKTETILKEIVLNGDEADIRNGKTEIQVVAQLISNIEKNDITFNGYFFKRISICQPILASCISHDGKTLQFYNINKDKSVDLFQTLTVEELMSQHQEGSKLKQTKFTNIQETIHGLFVTIEGITNYKSTTQIVMKFTHPNIKIPTKKDHSIIQKAFQFIMDDKIHQAFNLLMDYETNTDPLDFGYDIRELMMLDEKNYIVLTKGLVHSQYSSILFNSDGSAKKQFRDSGIVYDDEGKYFGPSLLKLLNLRQKSIRNLPQEVISINERISIDNFIFISHVTQLDILDALMLVKESKDLHCYCSLTECSMLLDENGVISQILSKEATLRFKAMLLQTYYNQSIRNLNKSFSIFREFVETTQDEKDFELIEFCFKKMFQQKSRNCCNLELLKEIYWKNINYWFLAMDYRSSIRSMISNLTILGVDIVFRYINNLSQSYTFEIIEKLIDDMKAVAITTSEMAVQYYFLLALVFPQSETSRGGIGNKVTKNNIIHGMDYLEHFIRIKTDCPALQVFINFLMKQEFSYLNLEMKENMSVKELTERNVMLLQKFTDWNTVSIETMKELLEFNGYALEFLPNSFQDDESLVSIAVKSRGLSLKYASERLRNNPTIVDLAVSQNYYSFEYASRELKNDKMKILEYVERNGLLLEIVPGIFKEDLQIVQMAIAQNPLSIQFASEKFKYGKNLITPLIEKKGELLKFASNSLQSDSNIILTATKTFGLAILYSTKKLDTELILDCVKINKLYENKQILNYVLETEQLREDVQFLFQLYQYVRDGRIEEIVEKLPVKSLLPHTPLTHNFKCRKHQI